jgi:glucose/arabinose dehydrogenase
MLKRALFSVFLALLVGLPPVILNADSAAAVPTGFADKLVRSVNQPTALAFTPDKRMLITTKPGLLRVFERGTPGTTLALDISGKTCSNGERGLLGVAVDPNFESNHFVYLYYTFNKHNACPLQEPDKPNNPVNRVSRFVMSGKTIDPSSERVLITNIPSPNGNHNAGDLHFGKDGYLYISVGDGSCDYAEPTKCQTENDAARDKNVLLGKILRINRNGGIPPDNPFTGENSDRCGIPAANGRTEPGRQCQETFAWGLRNPFRMAFDPDATGTSFRINDVGAATWEEIDRGQKGADYGWNCREGTRVNSTTGKCDPTPEGMVGPIHQYNHSTGCRSITGGAFVPDSASWRPASSYNRAYLFGDFACDTIFKLTPKSGGGFARTVFAAGVGGVVAMTFGPLGNAEALYYMTYSANGGEVRRISYTGGN